MALKPNTSDDSPENSGQTQAVDTVQASDRGAPEEDLGETSDGEGLISVSGLHAWHSAWESITDNSSML